MKATDIIGFHVVGSLVIEFTLKKDVGKGLSQKKNPRHTEVNSWFAIVIKVDDILVQPSSVAVHSMMFSVLVTEVCSVGCLCLLGVVLCTRLVAYVFILFNQRAWFTYYYFVKLVKGYLCHYPLSIHIVLVSI